MLQVVEPAMYLKEILCCGWYNLLLWCSGGYYLSFTLKDLHLRNICFDYKLDYL